MAREVGSISEPAQTGNTIKRRVPAYEWFAIIKGETRDPIVILPQSPARPNQFTVKISGGFRYAAVQWVNPPSAEISPGIRGPQKNNRCFSHADDASPNRSRPVGGHEGLRRPTAPRLKFPHPMNQKRRVRYHLRPPERRPRSLRTFSAISGSICGGGSRL